MCYTLLKNNPFIQRIKAAEDREREIDYQIKATLAKLQALGISTEDLELRTR